MRADGSNAANGAAGAPLAPGGLAARPERGHGGAGALRRHPRARDSQRGRSRRAGTAGPPLPRYDHVVIVVEENHSYDQILGTPADPPLGFAPSLWPYLLNQPLPQLHDDYIRSLAAAGASFTNSHALTHPSQPNYLDL